MSEIILHLTGSFTITGTMWLGFGRCGMPRRSRRARSFATISRWRWRSSWLSFRWATLARAPATIAGGRAVVKMKPEAKLRTKSISGAEPAM